MAPTPDLPTRYPPLPPRPAPSGNIGPGDRPCQHNLSGSKCYFAYGSNLHMKQMQRRCPNSKYVGFGRLPDFRWHINERGFANVVQAEGYWVDGLVYEIDDYDEVKLDISEGVAKGAYGKQHIAVVVNLACCSLYRRSVSWIVAQGGPSVVGKAKMHSHRSMQPNIKRQIDDVLVYISEIHIADSNPREEYIQRMNRGLKDAASLGMDDDYVRNCIRPFVPEAGNIKPDTPASSKDTSQPECEIEV